MKLSTWAKQQGISAAIKARYLSEKCQGWGVWDEAAGKPKLISMPEWEGIYYVLLEGKEGADWGVRANPRSPRAGLPTFEHQGCEFLEGEPAPGTVIEQRIHRQVFEHMVPGVLRAFDLPDLVSSLAPRPAWVVNGVNALGQRVSLAEIKKQYAASAAAIRERRGDDKPAVFYRDWVAGK